MAEAQIVVCHHFSVDPEGKISTILQRESV